MYATANPCSNLVTEMHRRYNAVDLELGMRNKLPCAPDGLCSKWSGEVFDQTQSVSAETVFSVHFPARHLMMSIFLDNTKFHTEFPS